jgi:two-component system, cell cycle response regulator
VPSGVVGLVGPLMVHEEIAWFTPVTSMPNQLPGVESCAMNNVALNPAQNILVVDDEQAICDILSEALDHLGHRVETARDGVEAIQKIEDGDFSIVITDMMMPRMDGMELIEYLVKNRKGIDIIAITGHTMSYQYTDVIAAGAADFIAKPFTINELEAKLKRIFRERHLLEELERLAVKDPLTGLYNRRLFEKTARKEAIRAARYHHPLCLFFFDIDNFKEYNDLHGHQAGDQVLIHLAEILTTAVRHNVDTAYRFGGDEFTLLLPYLTTDAALKVAARILEAYNRLQLEPTFLSIGIAHFLSRTGSVDKDIQDMVQRSDRALYYAKHSLGGNRAHFDEESALISSL